MNLLGKTFVLIYGTGSIFCLIVAMTIATQKMNFVPAQGEAAAKAKSRVDESIARTKILIKANNRAYTRWLDGYEQVIALEADQYQRREFYRGQMELVRTGKYEGAAKEDAVQELPELDPTTGLLKIDKPTGRDKVVKVRMSKMMENAKPQNAYVDAINKTYGMDEDGVPKLQDQDKAICEEITKATHIINGIPGETKGLRTRIDEQILIGKDADAERIYLEDFITNRRADAQLFVKRRDALEASIARLLRRQGN